MKAIAIWLRWTRQFLSPENLGQWVVSYKFWLGLALVRIPVGGQHFLAPRVDYWSVGLPVLLISYLASGVPLLVASLTVLKNRRTEPPKPVIGIIVWLLSDLVLTQTAVSMLGTSGLRNPLVAQPLQMVFHAIGTVIFGGTMMVALCQFLLGRKHTEKLRALASKKQELLLAANEYRVSIRESYRAQVASSILPGLERIKCEVEQLLVKRQARGKFKEFAERVRDFSFRDVRELSHQIAASEVSPLDENQVKVEEILEKSRLSPLVLKPANPYMVAGIFFAYATVLVSPDSRQLSHLLVLAVVWSASDVCSKFHDIFADADLKIRFAIMTMSVVLPVTLATITEAALTPLAPLHLIAIFTAATVTLAALISYPLRFNSEVAKRLEVQTEQTTNLLAAARIDANEIRDSFSRFLHGKIQGRLAMLSFVLGQIANGEVKGKEKTKQVGRLIEMLDTIEHDLYDLTKQQEARTLEQSVGSLADDWRGLIDMTLSLPNEASLWLAENKVVESQASALIEEAVVNARVHGLANNVSISIEIDHETGDRLRIEILDDGRGLDSQRETGLGSRQFSAVCETWTLERTNKNATKFSAVILGAQS